MLEWGFLNEYFWFSAVQMLEYSIVLVYFPPPPSSSSAFSRLWNGCNCMTAVTVWFQCPRVSTAHPSYPEMSHIVKVCACSLIHHTYVLHGMGQRVVTLTLARRLAMHCVCGVFAPCVLYFFSCTYWHGTYEEGHVLAVAQCFLRFYFRIFLSLPFAPSLTEQSSVLRRHPRNISRH